MSYSSCADAGSEQLEQEIHTVATLAGAFEWATGLERPGFRSRHRVSA